MWDDTMAAFVKVVWMNNQKKAMQGKVLYISEAECISANTNFY
jgi:hypothetical protein